MNLDLLCLLGVFIVIVAVIWMRKPLYVAMICGIISTILLFRIHPLTALRVIGKQAVAWETISTLLAFYVIIFTQLMMEKKQRLQAAEHSFHLLIRDRRMNTIIPTAIMGLLPSAAVMTVCAEMVDKTAGEYLDAKEKTMVAAYYRHIPEMFIPTYTTVILGLALSGVDAGLFILLMTPMAILSCVICYFFYLRKIPREMPPVEEEIVKSREIRSLLVNLWPLIAILVLLVAFDLPIIPAAAIVIVINLFVDHFKAEELPDLIIRSAEPVLLGNMFLIMLFKGILSYTGVIEQLPVFFSNFPIPMSASFALLFFVATVVAGSQAIIALCTPMAYAAIPDGGVGLFVILMGMAWAAMQISPTHVCSFVAADYYKTTLGDLVVRALPVVIIFSVLCYFYGCLLMMV